MSVDVGDLRASVTLTDAATPTLAAISTSLKAMSANATAAAKSMADLSGQLGGAQSKAAADGLNAVGGAAKAADGGLGGMLKTAALATAGMVGLSVGIEGVKGAIENTLGSAAKYQTELVTIANNTNISTAAMNQMGKDVQAISVQTGANMDQIAHGVEHAMNVTQDYNGALAITKVATESAFSTGANAAEVTNLLANAMHEYGIDTDAGAAATGRFRDAQDAATQMMGAQHLAASDANTDLGSFTEATARATGIAANLGISYNDVFAATSALTRHGFPDVFQAGTQVTDMLTHMMNPSVGAKEALVALAKASGDDVGKAFSAGSLSTNGLIGTINMLKKAMDDAGYSTAQQEAEMNKLVPALRGGLGAAALTGTALSDLNKTQADLNDTTKTSQITQDSFNRMLQTTQGQADVLKARLETLGLSIGGPLNQAAEQVLAGINTLADRLGALGQAAGIAASEIGPAFAGLAPLAGPAATAVEALVGTVLAFQAANLAASGATLAVNTATKLWEGTMALMGPALAAGEMGVAALSRGFVALRDGETLAAAGALIFDGALAANPIGIALGAVVALGAGLVVLAQHFAPLQALITNTWNALKASPFGALADAVTGVGGAAATATPELAAMTGAADATKATATIKGANEAIDDTAKSAADAKSSLADIKPKVDANNAAITDTTARMNSIKDAANQQIAPMQAALDLSKQQNQLATDLANAQQSTIKAGYEGQIEPLQQRLDKETQSLDLSQKKVQAEQTLSKDGYEAQLQPLQARLTLEQQSLDLSTKIATAQVDGIKAGVDAQITPMQAALTIQTQQLDTASKLVSANQDGIKASYDSQIAPLQASLDIKKQQLATDQASVQANQDGIKASYDAQIAPLQERLQLEQDTNKEQQQQVQTESTKIKDAYDSQIASLNDQLAVMKHQTDELNQQALLANQQANLAIQQAQLAAAGDPAQRSVIAGQLESNKLQEDAIKNAQDQAKVQADLAKLPAASPEEAQLEARQQALSIANQQTMVRLQAQLAAAPAGSQAQSSAQQAIQAQLATYEQQVGVLQRSGMNLGTNDQQRQLLLLQLNDLQQQSQEMGLQSQAQLVQIAQAQTIATADKTQLDLTKQRADLTNQIASAPLTAQVNALTDAEKAALAPLNDHLNALQREAQGYQPLADQVKRLQQAETAALAPGAQRLLQIQQQIAQLQPYQAAIDALKNKETAELAPGIVKLLQLQQQKDALAPQQAAIDVIKNQETAELAPLQQKLLLLQQQRDALAPQQATIDGITATETAADQGFKARLDTIQLQRDGLAGQQVAIQSLKDAETNALAPGAQRLLNLTAQRDALAPQADAIDKIKNSEAAQLAPLQNTLDKLNQTKSSLSEQQQQWQGVVDAAKSAAGAASGYNDAAGGGSGTAAPGPSFSAAGKGVELGTGNAAGGGAGMTAQQGNILAGWQTFWNQLGTSSRLNADELGKELSGIPDALNTTIPGWQKWSTGVEAQIGSISGAVDTWSGRSSTQLASWAGNLNFSTSQGSVSIGAFTDNLVAEAVHWANTTQLSNADFSGLGTAVLNAMTGASGHIADFNGVLTGWQTGQHAALVGAGTDLGIYATAAGTAFGAAASAVGTWASTSSTQLGTDSSDVGTWLSTVEGHFTTWTTKDLPAAAGSFGAWVAGRASDLGSADPTKGLSGAFATWRGYVGQTLTGWIGDANTAGGQFQGWVAARATDLGDGDATKGLAGDFTTWRTQVGENFTTFGQNAGAAATAFAGATGAMFTTIGSDGLKISQGVTALAGNISGALGKDGAADKALHAFLDPGGTLAAWGDDWLNAMKGIGEKIKQFFANFHISVPGISVGGTSGAPAQTGPQLWASQSGQGEAAFANQPRSVQDLFNAQARKNAGSGAWIVAGAGVAPTAGNDPLIDFMKEAISAGQAGDVYGSGDHWQRYHESSGENDLEEGQDIGMPFGTPIPGTPGGKITRIDYWGGQSDYAITETFPDGHDWTVGHVQALVPVGTVVTPGMMIASSRGLPSDISSGPHVEYQYDHGAENPLVAMNAYQGGGILTEPVLGVGRRTGQTYSFAEDGQEAFGPARTAGGAGGGNHYHVHMPMTTTVLDAAAVQDAVERAIQRAQWAAGR